MSSIRMTRRTALGSVLAASATSIAGRRALAQAQSGPVKVGFVYTLSGSLADLGTYSLVGAQLAVKEVNDAGGINGRPMELVVRDSRFDPKAAVAAMHELAGTGVNIIIGEGSSNMVIAVLPIIKDLNVIYLSPAGILMDATHNLFTPHYFRVGANAHMQYGGQAEVMARVAPNAVRWGGIVMDALGARSGWEALSLALQRSYPKIAGKKVEIVDPVLVKPGAGDYRDAIGKLVSQNLDGIQTGVFGGEAISFYQQAKPFGLFKTIKAVADTVLATHAGPALKSAVPPNFWSYCIWNYDGYKQVPMAQRFYKGAVDAKKETDVDPFMAHAHTALMSVAAGVRAAGTSETKSVIAAMEKVEFDSIFGKLRYRTEDHQLLINPGYIHVEPEEAAPGFKITQFLSVPWQNLIEPASPGVAFKES